MSGLAFIRRRAEEALLVVVETRALVRDEGKRTINLPGDLSGPWSDLWSDRVLDLGGEVALRDLPPPPILMLRATAAAAQRES